MRHIEIVIAITCELDEKYFDPWENLSPEQRAIFEQHATRCGGGGAPGPRCMDCHFCQGYEVINIEEELDGA